ncbi:MAG: hypothetical protein ACKODH_04280 [Limisphaerales bacterium]
MDQLKRNLTIGLIVVVIPLLLLWAWWPQESEALPPDNGFEDFLAAGRIIAPTPGMPRSVLSGIRPFVSDPTNAEAMQLLQRGLKKTSRVPLYAMAQDPAMANEYFRGALALGKGLRIEVLYQWQTLHNTNEARRLLVDLFRFGHEAYRGGLFGHARESSSIEEDVSAWLTSLLPEADAAACRQVVQVFAELDQKADSPARMWQRDLVFKGRTNVWQIVVPDGIYHSVRPDFKKQKEEFMKFTTSAARVRKRSLVEHAAKLCELETGKRPSGFRDLVPQYLKAVPKDPETGRDLSYAF